jgi:aminoglycoside phosphotransferase
MVRFAFSQGFFLKPCTTVLAAVWRHVPATLRIRVYRCLARLGDYLWGRTCSLSVQRLPFGLYLKTRNVTWHRSLENEYGALELVRRHTDVVVPRPLDLVSDGNVSYLLISAVPDYHVGLCIDAMSDEEVANLVRDLRAWLVQLRSIPKTVALAYEITNAVGDGVYNGRVTQAVEYDEARGDFFGPFKDEDDFNNTLRCGALPDVVHRSGHKIVLTHGDINMRNIMVKDGKLSCIIDFETAAWLLEYWDYTKARWVTKFNRRWIKIVDKVFEELGDYEEELATERKFWEYVF